MLEYDLWCNLKGDLVGGTRADTVSRWTPLPSLFGSEAEFNLGCCCLKTSTLGPEVCPLTVPDTDNLLIALCHFLVRNLILETAMTTLTAALNRPRGRRWEESGGDGRAPI